MTASLIAASVDQTRGNIFLTPLIELATLNSHTVTQNCTASWTTKRNKKETKEKKTAEDSVRLKNFTEIYKITLVYCVMDTAVYLKLFSSTAWC